MLDALAEEVTDFRKRERETLAAEIANAVGKLFKK